MCHCEPHFGEAIPRHYYPFSGDDAQRRHFFNAYPAININLTTRFVFSLIRNGCARRYPGTQTISSPAHTSGHPARARFGIFTLM
jgi:hypothetical protein